MRPLIPKELLPAPSSRAALQGDSEAAAMTLRCQENCSLCCWRLAGWAWSPKDTAGCCSAAPCVAGLGTQQHHPGSQLGGNKWLLLEGQLLFLLKEQNQSQKQACSLPYRQSVLALEFLRPDSTNASFPTDQMPEVNQLLI